MLQQGFNVSRETFTKPTMTCGFEWVLYIQEKEIKTMTKSEQLNINETIVEVVYDLKKEFNALTHLHRLRTCQANVYTLTNNERYVVLESYNTIVAIYDRKTGWMYDILRFVYGYTATSAQHIAKFKNEYKPIFTLRYYPVR